MSGAEDSRRQAKILTTTVGDPVARRDTYDVTIDGRVVRMFHGDMMLVGTEGGSESQPTAVSVALAFPTCGCGCNKNGRGIEVVIVPEHARLMAKQLLEAADEVDAAAKQCTDALIARLRGGAGGK